MRWLIFFFAALFLLGGCAQQAPTTVINADCSEEVKDLQSSWDELNLRISQLEEENTNLKQQLDDYYFTEIVSDIDLLEWSSNEIVKAISQYDARFGVAGWWTYFYNLEGKYYYYQQGNVFPEDPFFNLRYRNSDQELNFSSLRIFDIALGNKTAGDEEWKSYLGKVLRESQADSDLTCYQQTACRQIKVIKCNKDNQKLYVWSEGTHILMSRNDDGIALDAFERFYCTQ